MTTKQIEALKLALEAAKGIRLAISEGRTAHAENDAAILEHIINNALAEQPAQPSKPLTDEQIEQCMKQAYATVQGRNLEHAFARAIEAAHGITGEQR